MSLPATAAAHPVLSAVVCLGVAGLLVAPYALAVELSSSPQDTPTLLSLPRAATGQAGALHRLAAAPLRPAAPRASRHVPPAGRARAAHPAAAPAPARVTLRRTTGTTATARPRPAAPTRPADGDRDRDDAGR